MKEINMIQEEHDKKVKVCQKETIRQLLSWHNLLGWERRSIFDEDNKIIEDEIIKRTKHKVKNE
jgi:hypothetical protein